MLTTITGFDRVRQQVHRKDIEAAPGVYYWDERTNIVADVSAAHLKLPVNIAQSPSCYPLWNGDTPRDPQVMGNFVAAMVKRYGNRIAAVEIWNEPNLAVKNGGRVTTEDPGRYVAILVECYRRIKAINYVLAAAAASTGVFDPNRAIPDIEYLRAMYTYRNSTICDYFNVQAVHLFGQSRGSTSNIATIRGWVGAMFLWNMNFAVLWGTQGNLNHKQASLGLLNLDWDRRSLLSRGCISV